MKYGRHPPNLELPQVCDHHLFMSHFWHTGQDKCHAIARKLQLFMPTLKIWLDVDNLDDIEKLEHYVEKSAVVLIFYSDGYFGSKNCRREFVHALKKNKPLIVVYDGPNEIIEKCQEFCSKEALAKDGYSDSVVSELQNKIEDFAKKHDDPNESIQWLKVSAFSTESLKLIYMKLLLNLPRSKMDKNYRESLIEYGLQLPKEISLLSKIEYGLNILVCHKNAYAVELAEEIKANSPKVNVLKETTEEWNSTEDTETLASSVQTEEIQESMLDSYMHSISEFFWGKSKPMIDENQTSVAFGNESPKKGVSVNDSPTEIYETKIPTVLLLHLNKDTFNEENRESMIASIKIAQRRQDVKIILVHEQDSLKNAATDFGYFFEVTPQTLDPSQFYREIAIPLYTRKEYRKVSLHFIIQKANSYFLQNASTSSKNQSMMVSLRRQSVITQTSGYTALK